MSDRHQDYRFIGSISQSQYDSLNEKEHQRMLESSRNQDSWSSNSAGSSYSERYVSNLTGGQMLLLGHLGGLLLIFSYWSGIEYVWAGLQSQLAPSLPFGLSYVMATLITYLGTIFVGSLVAQLVIAFLRIVLGITIIYLVFCIFN